MRRHLSSILLATFIVGLVAVVLWQSIEARQIAKDAISLVFTFFTTPFILETTVGILGLAIVLSINHYRVEKENDEWVEMEVPQKEAAATVEPSQSGSPQGL